MDSVWNQKQRWATTHQKRCCWTLSRISRYTESHLSETGLHSNLHATVHTLGSARNLNPPLRSRGQESCQSLNCCME